VGGAPIKCSGASATRTSEAMASAVIPANMVMVMPPMMAKVCAAFLLLGSRRFGTPLLTASTPVNAVQPWEKARSTIAAANRPVVWWV
jgi:hypothetical protein